MAALHLQLDATSAAEHAALAEAISMRGGRVATIVRWLEHALGRALEVHVAPYPLEVARSEFRAAADRAREVADHCPVFGEKLAPIESQAAAAKTAEELAALARQVADGARRTVDMLLDAQRREAARRPA
jgi:hypothetical protein